MNTTHRSSFLRAFANRHAVLLFYALVFAIAFGPTVFLAGPGALLDTGADLTSPADLDPVTYLLLFVGGPSFALAAILVITLAFGRAGLRDLRSRLLRWRVGVRWYAMALLTAPVLWTAIVVAFSLTSKEFLPDILTADDRVNLVVAGLAVGLVAAFFEEIAWTGFATPELTKRHGVLATGLIVGVLWYLVHLSLFAGTASGDAPQALAVAAPVLWILPFRVLMVWVYAHTQSVLPAMLMHLTTDLCAFVLLSSAMVGTPDLVFNLVFGATLWLLVGAVAAADGRLSRPGSEPTPAGAPVSK
jgi:membrane protease YdiL (CAAX protease family)